MKFAIASLSLLLVACHPSQPPAGPVPPAASQDVPVSPAAEAPSAKRAPGQENVEPLRIFRAFGTEPFWNVNVEGSTLTFTTPENPDGVVMRGARRVTADGIEISGGGDHAPAFQLEVSAGNCSDGMSDKQYELKSTFRYGDGQRITDYKGCGEAVR